MTRVGNRNNKRGQCLAELLAGGMVLVTISMFGLDVITMAVTSRINNHLAKTAARAAANQENSEQAMKAARVIIDGTRKGGIITSVKLEEVNFAGKQVSVKTMLSISLPAPFPFMNQVSFRASATEVVVGVPAEFNEAT
jgi:hypothetical protein